MRLSSLMFSSSVSFKSKEEGETFVLLVVAFLCFMVNTYIKNILKWEGH